MASKTFQRHYSFLGPLKYPEMKKKSLWGTLSPDTVTTTSSGYSTGSSSFSTTIVPSSHHSQKIKSKSIQNLISKFKNWISTPKSKLVRSTTTKEMPSTNNTIIRREYPTSYDLSSSTIPSSQTISLPFTYYPNSNSNSNRIHSIKTTNFDQISAWLDRSESLIEEEEEEDVDDQLDFLFIDEFQEQNQSSSSSIEIDYQMMMMMKKTSMNNRTPRRSTSLVSTISRPMIQSKPIIEKSISPSSSFSSSILIRGMSENISPPKSYHLSRVNLHDEQNHQQVSPTKSNRRRAIDFNRRRTVAGANESLPQNNKENIPQSRRQQIYRFSPSTSNNSQTKKYFFHSNSSTKNDDMLMNSYGLTLLQPSSFSTPRRQSVTANITLVSPIQINPSRPLISSDPLDDLLCDREVESYFYPPRSSQHIYINLQPSPNTYFPGTLC